MDNRMALLLDMQIILTKYTDKGGNWRPGLCDIWTYNALINMHESDDEDGFQTYIWRNTPDEIMEYILQEGRIFDLEYGVEDLYEALREYMLDRKFIVNIDEVDDEELQTNLEGK
jgi:hypothetical protein